jgi:hypothetical protein
MFQQTLLIIRCLKLLVKTAVPPFCGSTQIHMDLWNSAMGDSQPPIPISKSSSAFNPRLIHSECTSVHNNHSIREDLQMNTVLSEIKKWITKYLRKLENRSKSQAVEPTKQ